MIETITNVDALKLHSMARRMLYRRLRLYGMTLQSADIDDLTTDSLIHALEMLAAKPPRQACDIRGAVYTAVQRMLVNWIERSACHDGHLQPFADDRIDSADIADTQTSETRLPRYVANLCQSVEELAVCIVLSGMTFDGRLFLEMSNEMASAELGCSVRQVQRHKATLRQRFALFAPAQLSDTLANVIPD